MAVSSFLQWFGGNRKHAEKVGQLMGKQDLIGVMFAGGLSELKFLEARQFLINDKNAHLHNLFRIASDHSRLLTETISQTLYHPETLAEAKRMMHGTAFERAVGYFLINWLTRCSGGTEKELEGSLGMRWTASGGSSIARFRSAVEGLPEWCELLKTRCECVCLEWREVAKNWVDRKGHGLYLDPPWIDLGDGYAHRMTIEDHMIMSGFAKSLRSTRVVVRHSAHPLYREWYCEAEGWAMHEVDAKNQHGNDTNEVLFVNEGVQSGKASSDRGAGLFGHA